MSFNNYFIVSILLLLILIITELSQDLNKEKDQNIFKDLLIITLIMLLLFCIIITISYNNIYLNT